MTTKIKYSSAICSFFTAAILLFQASAAFAAYPYVRNFKKTDYRAGTQNWAVTQNGGGFMYFANNNGLLEFDGQKWECYPILNKTAVRSVFHDSESGRIYAGAFDEFGYYELSSHGKMEYHSLTGCFGNLEGVSEIWRIHKIDSLFYLQDDNRIYQFNGEKITAYEAGAKINCSAVIGGVLYVASLEKGIMQLQPDGLVLLDGIQEMQNKKVCSILPFQGNGMLLVTEFDGIYSYSGKKIRKIKTEIDDLLSTAQVFCAATDGKEIAVGTVSDGVYILDENGQCDYHINSFTGMQNNSVLSLFYDAGGNVWAGLDRGIDYITIKSPMVTLFGSDKMYGTGYTSIVYDGKLYLGTNQGLYYIDFKDNSLKADSEIFSVKGITGQVWCLEEMDGDLLCGHDSGLYIITGSTSRKIPGPDGIWKMTEYDDLVLGCSYSGLFFLEKRGGQWRLRNYLKGFHESSSVFEAAQNGEIWMYHWMKGLYRLSINEARDSVTNVEYVSVEHGFPTANNNIVNKVDGKLVFSSEGGFYEFDEANDRMVPASRLNDMFNSPPVAAKISESPHGDLIFISETVQTLATRVNNGYILDSTSLKFIQTERIPGFEHVNWIERDGFIINTETGFSWINLDKLRPSDSDAPVVIKRVSLPGAPDSLVYGARMVQDGSPKDRIRLPYNQNSLSFEFVAPKYDIQDAIMYSYRLERFDSEWSDWSLTNVKEYTRLPAGNYVFRVRATDIYFSDMTQNSLSFTILQPWYKSSVAVIVYLGLLAVLILLIVKYTDRRAARQARAMEEQKEEEIRQQSLKFQQEQQEKEKEIVLLKNESLEHDLKHKSQDLANSTMNLIRKNEILIRVKNNLNKVYSEVEAHEDRTKTLKRIQKIQTDISENIGHDDDWQKFSSNFDTVYEDYLKRLKQQFPQLTVSDMRICAYLKMNLSSKDIASMQNMSVRSVEMSRYRLRQKLGLTGGGNLTEFLQDF